MRLTGGAAENIGQPPLSAPDGFSEIGFLADLLKRGYRTGLRRRRADGALFRQGRTLEYSRGVCRSRIPYLAAIERMGMTRRPVAFTQPRSEAGRAYRALWEKWNLLPEKI